MLPALCVGPALSKILYKFDNEMDQWWLSVLLSVGLRVMQTDKPAAH